MCNVEQEQRRLAEENEARLSYFIAHHVFHMNQLLKCSICFDIFEKPTTVFHCFHVFCEDCIKIYLDFTTTKEPPCPICQKPIPRNDLRPNTFLEKVTAFVSSARGQIDRSLGCDSLKPPSFQTILAKIKAKKEISPQSESVKPNNTPPPDFSLILKARKILIGPNNQIFSTVQELPPVPSVSFRDGSLKTPTSNKRNVAAMQRSVNKKLSLNNKDLFDVVRESPTQNPFFKGNKRNLVTKTYGVQKQQKSKSKDNTFADKIIQFEDNTNKINIIRWLNDSQNKFDSIPQSQENNVPELQSLSQFDMPSVSQRHKHTIVRIKTPPLASQINKQKLEQNKIRQKNEIITRLSRINSSARTTPYINKRCPRSRSLESSAKIFKPSQKLKRHSITAGETTDPNFIIEQFNSEDEVIFNGVLQNPTDTTAIVNLMEEECLRDIETQVLEQTMQNKPKVAGKRTRKAPAELISPKRSKRLSKKSPKLLEALDETNKRSSRDTSGWARMKAIKKTIRKVEIKPSKLTVTGVSRCSSTVNSSNTEIQSVNKTSRQEAVKKGKGRKIVSKVREPYVLLNRVDVGRSSSAVKNKSGNKDAKRVYNLDILELYFNENLNKLTSNNETPQKETENIKNKSEERISASGNNSSEKLFHSSDTIKNIKMTSPNKLSLSSMTNKVEQNEPKNISNKNKTSTSFEKKTLSSKDQLGNNSIKIKASTSFEKEKLSSKDHLENKSNKIKASKLFEKEKLNSKDHLENNSNKIKASTSSEKEKLSSKDHLENNSNKIKASKLFEKEKLNSKDHLENNSNKIKASKLFEKEKLSSKDHLENNSNKIKASTSFGKEKLSSKDHLENNSNKFKASTSSEKEKLSSKDHFENNSNKIKASTSSEKEKLSSKDHLENNSNKIKASTSSEKEKLSLKDHLQNNSTKIKASTSFQKEKLSSKDHLENNSNKIKASTSFEKEKLNSNDDDLKNNSKKVKRANNETSTPITISPIDKEKLKSKINSSQVMKATDKLSASFSLKSRKKLFADDDLESGINEIVVEKDKSLMSSCKANDESKSKENEKLSTSIFTCNSGKEKSNINDESKHNSSKKSKLSMHKFAEEVELLSESTNDSIPAVVDSKNNSKLIKSCRTTNKLEDYDDECFMKPTQVIAGEETQNQQNTIGDDDYDDIFAMPTQVIAFNDNQTFNEMPPQDETLETILKHKIHSLNDILNTPNFISKMKIILKEIEKTISQKESQHEPITSCKLINDAQIQTDGELSSFISHDATTQTLCPEEKIKHAAMQTDSCDTSRGFRISSTDLFNIRPITNGEMQTDAMACPKCNFVFGNDSKTKLLSNPNQISSDVLIKDSNIIKSLSEKYILTGSFDNIYFETQDVVKGKQIEGSSTSLKGSKVSQNGQNKENHNQNKIVTKPTTQCKKLNESRLAQKLKPTTSPDLTPEMGNKTQTKRTYKRIRKPSSGSDSDSDELPNNAKRNKFIQDDLSLHFASELQKEINQPSEKKVEEGNEFNFSQGSEGIDYGEYLQNVLKKCDEELMPKKSTPQQNKITVKPPPKRSKTQDMVEECKMILQEACSGAITIENTEHFSSNLHNNAKQNIPEPTKLTLTALEEEFQHNFSADGKGAGESMMEIDEDCNNALLAENFPSIEDRSFVKALDKKTETKNKFSESLFSSADNFTKSINNIPAPSQPSVHLDIHNESKKENNSGDEKEKNKMHESSLDELIEGLDEFNNSFRDNISEDVKSVNGTIVAAEIETVTDKRENLKKSNTSDRVKILQDIIIAKNDVIVDQGAKEVGKTDIEPKETVQVADDPGDESDDIFSDLDVVENTPPKKIKPVSVQKGSFLSQTYYTPGKIILPPLVDESRDTIKSHEPPLLTCLGEVFMPPPEFQDFSNDKTLVNNNEDNEEVDLKTAENRETQNDDIIIIHSGTNKNVPPTASSLTPDLLLPQTDQLEYNILNKKEPFITSTPYSEDSQILPAKSLNLSPIHMGEANKAINPILAAQNSKFSPLTIIKSKTPPPQRPPLLVTSTPKQKSILNYVRPTENLNTSFTKSEYGSQSSQKSVKESGLNKKPCVACTRMSKEQLLTITSLSNKKLISYASAFSSAVTHMIVDVNQHNCVRDHTMKFISAVAAGVWVLNFNWVEECLQQGRLLPEERFEALDMSGVAGPKKSRLMRLKNPMLKGFKIHAAGPFISTTQKEVENVITLLGGEIVPRPDDLMPSNGKICLIITEAKGSEEFDLYEVWMETLKVAVVDLEWLSRSVGQYEKLSLKSFALCSEDSICDLGYPAELLADVPTLYSHSTGNTM